MARSFDRGIKGGIGAGVYSSRKGNNDAEVVRYTRE